MYENIFFPAFAQSHLSNQQCQPDHRSHETPETFGCQGCQRNPSAYFGDLRSAHCLWNTGVWKSLVQERWLLQKEEVNTDLVYI